MGIKEGFPCDPIGDRKAEENGFRCFSVTDCWWWVGRLRSDTGSAAEVLKAFWEAVQTVIGDVKRNLVVPMMNIFFSFEVSAVVSTEEDQPFINGIDFTLKTARDARSDRLDIFP